MLAAKVAGHLPQELTDLIERNLYELEEGSVRARWVRNSPHHNQVKFQYRSMATEAEVAVCRKLVSEHDCRKKNSHANSRVGCARRRYDRRAQHQARRWSRAESTIRPFIGSQDPAKHITDYTTHRQQEDAPVAVVRFRLAVCWKSGCNQGHTRRFAIAEERQGDIHSHGTGEPTDLTTPAFCWQDSFAGWTGGSNA